jgi:crotonobetainyl-CoA:carnitine CoA-transferase CaiB-like acyl-CoA transferase
MSNKPSLISHRRIDHLKARAFDCGFSNEDAKQFGKLSKTATWEALLKTYGIPLQAVDSVDNIVDTEAQSLDTVIGLTTAPSRSAILPPGIPPIFWTGLMLVNSSH